MQNFIVLGYIPGTNYQTTFSFWVYVAAGFFGLLLLPKAIRLLKELRHAIASRQADEQFEQLELISL